MAKAGSKRTKKKAVSASRRAMSKFVRDEKKKANFSRKRSYTLRDLNGKDTKTFNRALVLSGTKHAKIDKLLRPGEIWGASIFGNGTLQTFDSFELLHQYLYERYSDTFKKYGNDLKYTDELITNIKMVKFGSGPRKGETEEETEERNVRQYQKKLKAKQAKRMEETKTIEQEARKFIGKKEPRGQKKSRIELLRDVLADASKYRNQFEDAMKRIAALEKQMRISAKPAGKKRSQAKPAGKKRAVAKPAGKKRSVAKPAAKKRGAKHK